MVVRDGNTFFHDGFALGGRQIKIEGLHTGFTDRPCGAQIGNQKVHGPLELAVPLAQQDVRRLDADLYMTTMVRGRNFRLQTDVGNVGGVLKCRDQCGLLTIRGRPRIRQRKVTLPDLQLDSRPQAGDVDLVELVVSVLRRWIIGNGVRVGVFGNLFQDSGNVLTEIAVAAS